MPDIFDPMSVFDMSGRVVIVTGASSGLGERFSRVFHAVGGTVVAVARRQARLDALAADLPGLITMVCDVADQVQRENMVRDVIATCGRIDVLVNNAGIGHTVAVEDESVEQFREVLEVNVTAVWHLSKLCGEHMVAQGRGSVVNIASVLGLVGSAPFKQANYVASKAAVVNLSRELALQWARKGVRVNALCPGWFPSEMTEPMQGDAGSRRFLERNSPMPRMGEVHELDGAVLFLASDASSYMTGQTLVVDGGWTAR